MDIDFFLKERTKFIKYFYENGSAPFETTMALIEKGLDPYIPSYSEDPEPPYLSEWLNAQTALYTVGHTALSMLSSSIDLFLKEWLSRIENWSSVEVAVNFKKNGGLRQCSEIFTELGMKVRPCPADIDLIEQVLLARNRVQHPEQLTSLRVEYNQKDLRKYPQPFFARESEYSFFTDKGDYNEWLIPPTVIVTKEMILEAILQVELFCSWLDSEYWDCKNA